MVHYVRATARTYTCTVVNLCVVHAMKQTFLMDFSTQCFLIKFVFHGSAPIVCIGGMWILGLPWKQNGHPVECFMRETLMLCGLISLALVVGPPVCTKRHWQGRKPASGKIANCSPSYASYSSCKILFVRDNSVIMKDISNTNIHCTYPLPVRFERKEPTDHHTPLHIRGLEVSVHHFIHPK